MTLAHEDYKMIMKMLSENLGEALPPAPVQRSASAVNPNVNLSKLSILEAETDVKPGKNWTVYYVSY